MKRDPAHKNYELYLRSGHVVSFYGARFRVTPDAGVMPASYELTSGDSSRRLVWVDPGEIVAVVVVDDGVSERPTEDED